ncbi:MAG: efflux RND transporter permease subunit [Flavobacteriales bacterium]
MWDKIAHIIIRNRVMWLVIIGILTIGLGYKATSLKPTYKFSAPIPKKDKTYKDFEKFQSLFKSDGNLMVLGFQDSAAFEPQNFRAWVNLIDSISAIEGVDGILSYNKLPKITYNKPEDKFEFSPIADAHQIKTQQEISSFLEEIKTYPFYSGLLYNEKSGAILTAVTLNKEILDSKAREVMSGAIIKKIEQFEEDTKIDVKLSGMPHIRIINTIKVKDEIGIFIGLAMLVTAFIMFLFFRSISATLFSVLVVGIGVVWSMGTMALLGFNITILSGMIPPLIIVIGIPNCVFLLNKYHYEYQEHGQKILALKRVIEKVGNASFMTNLTTAAGFATFILTGNQMLIEFGIIASMNIVLVFVISLIVIPSVYTGLQPPKAKHLRHLKRKWMNSIISWMVKVVQFKKGYVYITTAVLIVVGAIGISKIQTSGTLTDDIPKEDELYKDMHFVETEFEGVLPFEILVDTKKKQGVLKLSTLKRIDKFQKRLNAYSDLGKSNSLVDVLKFTKQAYFNGKEDFYDLPSRFEKDWILKAIKNTKVESKADSPLKFDISTLADSTMQIARISVMVKDVGAVKMREIKANIQKDIADIFPESKYEITVTGSSVMYYRGTEYLIDNLYQSLGLAIIIIALLMAFMFKSWRMVLVSLLPNILPLILTAGIMGYAGIVIKPSTVLVFSIAFGISIDDTIHFLAKYRQELGNKRWNLKSAILAAVRETGVSMIYTSIVLFFGFSIFMASSFGGTVALGMLVSISLLIAMMSNLILLPSLLMSLDKILSKQILKEPFFETWDEEEDIDFDALKIKKNNNNK